MVKKFVWLALAVSVCSLGSLAQASMSIDEFADAVPQIVPAVPPLLGPAGSVATGSVAGLNVLDTVGGSRDIQIKITNAPQGVASVFVIVAPGGISLLSSQVGLTGSVEVTTQWDATVPYTPVPNVSGLGGVDLTATCNAFQIRGTSDLGYSLTMRVYQQGTGTLTSETQLLPAGNIVSDVFFPFAGFSGINPLAIISNAGAIELFMVTSLADADASLKFVRCVATPEPTSALVWSLLGAAFVGGGAWRRRRLARG